MKLYRFSPIKTESELLKAATYTAEQMTLLAIKLTDNLLPISSVKIFSHYPSEYKTLVKILDKLGEPSLKTHTSYYVKLNKPLVVNGHKIWQLGTRIADPYRNQVGCGDFRVNDYVSFQKHYISNQPKPDDFIRIPVGHTLTMIELWHPNYDVLGYVLSPKSEWQ